MLLRITAFSLLALVVVVAADDCTFTPKCDYGKGSRAMPRLRPRMRACAAAAARPGCAAGFDGKNCWFK